MTTLKTFLSTLLVFVVQIMCSPKGLLTVWWDAGTIDTNQTNIQLLKNGSTQIVIQQAQILTGAGYGQELDTIVYFNGSTDYVELYGYVAIGQILAAAASATYFQAALVRTA